MFKQLPTMSQHVPDPILFGPQNWEQPADSPRAKQLLGKMCGAKTKTLRKDDAFPLAKINSVIQQACVEWAQLDKEMTDNLIATGGRANGTHFLLLHKPTGLPNGETDKKAIQRKQACITIARVMVHNHLDFWIKEKALHLWIEQFLPKFSPTIFMPDQLLCVKHWVC